MPKGAACCSQPLLLAPFVLFGSMPAGSARAVLLLVTEDKSAEQDTALHPGITGKVVDLGAFALAFVWTAPATHLSHLVQSFTRTSSVSRIAWMAASRSI